MDSALCAQTDPDLFFPEKNGSSDPARRICAVCPVRAECLEFALANKEAHGVWGGMSPAERRKLQRRGRYSNDGLKDAVRDLHKAGLLDSEIAARVGVSDTHASRVRRGLGLAKNRRVA
jgi:WhiB family redox-sensing transcriptional regulator